MGFSKGKGAEKRYRLQKTTAVATYYGFERRSIFSTDGSFGFLGHLIFPCFCEVRSTSTSQSCLFIGISASSKPTTEFAQPRLSRVKGRSSPARGCKFGCVCSCMAGHEDAWAMTVHIGTNTRPNLYSLAGDDGPLTLLKRGCANSVVGLELAETPINTEDREVDVLLTTQKHRKKKNESDPKT